MIINDKRALAYVQTVHDIEPIAGADRIEKVHVLGWSLIAVKGEFQEGDKCVFFEIDSKVPETDERFAFLAAKHYKVKTYKLNKFGVVSQGLALPLSSFPEFGDIEVGTDVTEALRVTYAVKEDNVRKASGLDITMQNLKSRKPKLFQNKAIKWLMKRKWGRKVVLVLFGRKKDKPLAFPSQYVSKTDEERIQNIPDVLQIKAPFVVTEKIDGTSTTFVLVKHKFLFFKRYEFIVSSRNVRQATPDQKCYHDENVYWNMAIKYDIKNVLKTFIDTNPDRKFVALQGETYGANLQGNPYKLDEVRFAGFNLIIDGNRLGTLMSKSLMDWYNIPWVPIVYSRYTLPSTVDELLTAATGPSAINNDVLREGWVIRSIDGQLSFKAVSPEYLMKKGE